MDYLEIVIGASLVLFVLLVGLKEKNWKPLLGLIGVVLFLILAYFLLMWIYEDSKEVDTSNFSREKFCKDLQSEAKLTTEAYNHCLNDTNPYAE